MSGQTLIGGTQYEISGGKCLINGTEYSIKKGKTLVSGTEYNIDFIKSAIQNLVGHASSNYSYINCVTYANGYFVAGGMYYNSAGTISSFIAYTTDPTGTWTIKEIWNSGLNSSRLQGIMSVTYANGYWVVGGNHYNGSYQLARIAYTTNLTGTWTTKDLWTSSQYYGYDFVSCITYANGHWVVGGEYGYSYYNARVAYTTDLAGSWTTVDLWGGNTQENSIRCITYVDGYWVVGGAYQVSNTRYYARIAYTTDLTGSWTTKDVWSSNNGSASCVYGIIYTSGYWVVCGSARSSSQYLGRMAYTTSLAGTWTTKDLWNAAGETLIQNIVYADGYFVVSGKYCDNSNVYARIAYATNPTGTWTTNDLWSASYTGYNGSSYLRALAYANGYWVAGGSNYDNGSGHFTRIAADNSSPPFNSL